MSDSLWPHELQHTRPPCPSPTPGVHPNPCPSSRWCHPAISSSVVPFSSCPQSLPASGSFAMSQLFTWGGQSIGVSASASVLAMNTQDWSPLGWTGWISLQSKGLSRVFSNTIVISQLQIPHHQKDPPKRDCSHLENSHAHSLRSCRIWIFSFFFEDCKTFFNLPGGIYPETTCLIQGSSSPNLFRDQEIYLMSILEHSPCQAVFAL